VIGKLFGNIFLILSGLFVLALVLTTGLMILAGSPKGQDFLNNKNISLEDNINVEQIAYKIKDILNENPKETDSEGIKEADLAMINQEKPKVLSATKEEIPEPIQKNVVPLIAAPKENKLPKVKLDSDGLKGISAKNKNSVNLIVRASDEDGKVTKVYLYLDSRKLTEIYPAEMTGKNNDWGDSNERTVEITKSTLNWLKEETGDNIRGFIVRLNKIWEDEKTDCGIPRGYQYIFYGNFNIYDVRVARDNEKYVICEASRGLNIDDMYVALYRNPTTGKHKVYAEAYDDLGAKSVSETIEFIIEP
jgi:hypothetical protein